MADILREMTHLRACRCGGKRVKLIKYVAGYHSDGTFFRCGCCACEEYALYAGTPEEAAENWEAGIYSQETLMFRNPTPAEKWDEDGVYDLVGEVIKTCLKDYKSVLKRGDTAEINAFREKAKSIPWFEYFNKNSDDILDYFERAERKRRRLK